MADLKHHIVLRYFEAIDAGYWDRVNSILEEAQKDKQLEDIILKAHDGLDWDSDIPLVQQVEKKLKEKQDD